MIRILATKRIKATCVAHSNAAIDVLASVVQRAAPELGAIRCHSYRSEKNAVRRQADILSGQDTIRVAEPEDEPVASEEARRIEAWHTVLSEITMKFKKWQSSKRQRPNHKIMGLNVRALQNAGILDHNIITSSSRHNDPHKAYREMFESDMKDASDDKIKKFRDLEEELL